MTEKLSHEVIEGLLDAVPVDITFVDEKDAVQYCMHAHSERV